MSHEAYRKTSRSLESARDAEYRAFSEATRLLIAAAHTRRQDLKVLIEAIHKNRELWSALADDCASAENQLPKETRAHIISLSRWVTDYSRDVMRKNEDPTPLIDVNRIIMEGLAGKSAA